MLDKRPVRTATKDILTLPHTKRALASGIALEWDLLTSARQALKHHYIPLTSLSSRAIDIRNADAQGDSKIRDSIVTMLMRYLITDTLLCWDPEKSIHDPTAIFDIKGDDDQPKQSLRQKQIETAEPILAYLTTHIFPGLEIVPVLGEDSIMPVKQPMMTQEVIRGWISGLPAFELAGLERGVLATKSLLVATRLLVEWSQEFKHLHKNNSTGRFGIAEARQASSVEVTWQTDMWGEVDDTHDVDKEDVARQLGSVILLVS
jgi:chaperone required for assembly of F1-ATPase